jgi:hypothetical protein
VLAVLGLLRLLIGFGSLQLERRRERLLRDGVPATAVVRSVTQLGTKSGYPLIEAKLEVTTADGKTAMSTRRGAIEPQYAGEMVEGASIPVRCDPDDPSRLAIAWTEL